MKKERKRFGKGRIILDIGAAAATFGILCVDGMIAVGLICTIGGLLGMLFGAAMEAGDS